MCSFYTWDGGTLNGVQIYNNTFYWNPASNMGLLNDSAAYSGSNANFFENNLIYSAVPDLISSSSHIHLDNNLYWTTSSGSPSWTYNGTTYTSFSSYQSGSGQDAHGQYANPQLNGPTYHGVGMPAGEFTLQPGSPALGAGTLIANNGGRDFFGNSVSSTAAPNIGAYNGTGYTAPTNLVSNGGFESGLSSWSSWSGTNTIVSTAHKGRGLCASSLGEAKQGKDFAIQLKKGMR